MKILKEIGSVYFWLLGTVITIVGFVTAKDNSKKMKNAVFISCLVIAVTYTGVNYVDKISDLLGSKTSEKVTTSEQATVAEGTKETEEYEKDTPATVSFSSNDSNKGEETGNWKVLYNSYSSRTSLTTYSGNRWNEFLYSQMESVNGGKAQVRIYYYRVHEKVS